MTIRNKHKLNHGVDMALILCPPWDIQMPPLGLAYIASNLKKRGFNIKVIDLNIDLYNLASQEHKKAWRMEYFQEWELREFHQILFNLNREYLEELMGNIIKNKPLLIGLSVNGGNINFSSELAKRLILLDPKIRICIGGPFSEINFIYNKEIKNFIDFALIGEAEEKLPEILKHLKGNSINTFKDIFYYKNCKFIKAAPINDLDALVSPTYKEFDLSKYAARELPIISSRGCIAQCEFCADWIQRKKYKYRTASMVVGEIEQHIKNYGINVFSFRDLIINGNLRNLEKICDLVIQKKLRIFWTGQGIINEKMSTSLLLKMKKSGFNSIVFGVESCSDKVLKAMNKPYRMKYLKTLLPKVHKAGISIYINIMTGFPGEGQVEFMETYNFILKHAKYIKGISSLTTCILIMDTSLYNNRKRYEITYPKKEGNLRWYTRDRTNNYMIRKERVKRIVNLCNAYNIEHPFVSLLDENSIQK